MCGTCTTLLDVAGTNAALVGVVAANRWERFKDRRVGRARLERDLMNWEANAAFMRELGLDPLATLGAPPTVPALDPVDDDVAAHAAADEHEHCAHPVTVTA